MIHINPFLEAYIPLVDFLAKVLGEDAEVVLHDVSDINCSVVAIANGHISNRTVGAPATNMALKFLKDKVYKKADYSINYKGKSSKGKALKSSTFFIKDNEKQIQGLLCINIDCEKFTQLRDFLDKYIGLPMAETVETETETETEIFSNSVEELAFDSIENTIKSYGIAPERMSADEKRDIIKQLNDNCVFTLKGTIPKVAKYLKVSEPTIYRYLNKIKSSDEM